MRALALASLLITPFLRAEPVWKAPETMPLGSASTLELRETDPNRPPLPRPGEDRLGPLVLLKAHPTADGRGWALTVLPLTPGTLVIPPLDLGDGRRTPECRIRVPRTVPHGAPWMGLGGGPDDALPPVPFPWGWASLLAVPLIPLGWWGVRRWRRGRHRRAYHHARRAFARHWPPQVGDRKSLDAAHAAGRDLLACRFGEEARSWGASDFEARGLRTWAIWVQSLDAARFGRKAPTFPPLQALVKPLEGPR